MEDDVTPDANAPIQRVETEGCATRLVAQRHAWTIDWHRVRTVALEDVFVYIDAPPFTGAVVADVRNAGDKAKLRAMWDAMRALAVRCGSTPDAPDEAGVTLP